MNGVWSAYFQETIPALSCRHIFESIEISATMESETAAFCYGREENFPCSANPIQAMSLGIATSGVALIMTVFLLSSVRRSRVGKSQNLRDSVEFTSSSLLRVFRGGHDCAAVADAYTIRRSSASGLRSLVDGFVGVFLSSSSSSSIFLLSYNKCRCTTRGFSPLLFVPLHCRDGRHSSRRPREEAT